MWQVVEGPTLGGTAASPTPMSSLSPQCKKTHPVPSIHGVFHQIVFKPYPSISCNPVCLVFHEWLLVKSNNCCAPSYIADYLYQGCSSKPVVANILPHEWNLETTQLQLAPLHPPLSDEKVQVLFTSPTIYDSGYIWFIFSCAPFLGPKISRIASVSLKAREFPPRLLTRFPHPETTTVARAPWRHKTMVNPGPILFLSF